MIKMLPKKSRKEEGQIVLIILLVMAVLLTIGLSIASRSVTDVKISQQSQESARALWVAQAGLEYAIKADAAVSNGNLNSVDYNVTKVVIGEEEHFLFPEKVGADETKMFWLIAHDLTTGEINPSIKYSGNHLVVYFGNKNITYSIKPAIEITYFYKNGSNKFVSERYLFDPDAARRATNNFTAAASVTHDPIGNTTFAYSGDFAVTGATPYVLFFKILYTNDLIPVALEAQNAQHPLMSQGRCFESTAVVPESQITKKLRECRIWEATPPIFNNLLFSGTNI